MTVIVASIAGYLTGGLPTADWVAKAFGVDLRASGSGNPGANNARRVGGLRVGISVLLVETAKGALVAGAAAGFGHTASAVAGVAAVVGNVVNPYRRFRGGQGLGITAGVLAATWPLSLAFVLPLIAVAVAITRSSPTASLITIAVLGIAALAWPSLALPVPWGLPSTFLPALAAGLTAVLTPKQVANLGAASQAPDRSSRTPEGFAS